MKVYREGSVEKELGLEIARLRRAGAEARRTHRPGIAVVTLLLSASACSLFPPLGTPAEMPAPAPSEKHAAASKPQPEDTARRLRRVGDVTVHRFSGSYRNTPLVLTERVVALEDALWVVDLTLEDAGSAARLRVRMDDEGEVISVARLDAEREIPASLSDYHAMVDKTVLAADSNEGLLSTERGTCVVGPRELECETKSYKVRLQDESAVLRVSASEQLPGRDVDGEITTDDGRLVYRAELVSFENQAASGSVAGR